MGHDREGSKVEKEFLRAAWREEEEGKKGYSEGARIRKDSFIKQLVNVQPINANLGHSEQKIREKTGKAAALFQVCALPRAQTFPNSTAYAHRRS